MQRLTFFYDETCKICLRFKEWILQQPAYIDLQPVPYQSPLAKEIYPSLDSLHPERELIALSDDGKIYQGASAWILCLYALKEYRPFAQKLSHPLLLPLAKKICYLISKNRLNLSALLFKKTVKGLAEKIDQQTINCEKNTCQIP